MLKSLLPAAFALSIVMPLGCVNRSYNTTHDANGNANYVPASDWYYPEKGAWSGRLILPAPGERRPDGGVWMEVYSGPRGQAAPSGRVWLTIDKNDQNAVLWSDRTTIDVNFDRSNGRADALRAKGNFLPERINGWTRVSPLESLAGARPESYRVNVGGTLTSDSVEVVLPHAQLRGNEIVTPRDPVQIIGRKVALVRFQGSAGDKKLRVKHWGGDGHFSGVEEVVRYDSAVVDAPGKVPMSSFAGIESSPLNDDGWFIFGEHLNGEFVVRSVEPRSLLDTNDDGQITGIEQGTEFFRVRNFENERVKLGKAFAKRVDPSPGYSFKPGDRGMVLHLFGSIGGENGDTPQKLPVGDKVLWTGHFSFGMSRIWREPIANESRFDIEYRQVYANNSNGIVSGAQKWAAYMGSVERGWAWSRPVSDSVAMHPAFKQPFDFGNGVKLDILEEIQLELDIMAGRYRSGDGTGTAEVTGPNSCVQDSNQALFIAMQRLMDWTTNDPTYKNWYAANGANEEGARADAFRRLVESYRQQIVPIADLRADWQLAARSPLAIQRQDAPPPEMLLRAVETHRTLIPRFSYDDISVMLLNNITAQWVFHSGQIGGTIPGIFPIAPGLE